MTVYLKVIYPWIETIFIPVVWVNRFINRQMEKRLLKTKKEKGIDVLKINLLLNFGISHEKCFDHVEGEFDCRNLDCNYGRVSSMLKFIENAKNTLDVCIYIITAKLFGDVIINAHKRGVKVRVVADYDMSFSAQSYINNFREKDIPTRQKRSPFIMHHKFAIVDSEILLNGSMNFTMTGVFCNWENVVITSQPELVDSFQEEFDKLWKQFEPVSSVPMHRP